ILNHSGHFYGHLFYLCALNQIILCWHGVWHLQLQLNRIMLRNFFTIALRNLYNSRFYTFINVLGLTIGITACLTIILYLRFETSYDRFNVNADRIVRIDWDLQMAGTRTHNAAVGPPLAQGMVAEFPDVEAAARMRYLGSCQFRRYNESIVESH